MAYAVLLVRLQKLNRRNTTMRTHPEGSLSALHFALTVALFGFVPPASGQSNSLVAAWGKNTAYAMFGPQWLANPRAISAGPDGNAVVTSQGGVVAWAQTSPHGQNLYLPGVSNAITVAGGVASGLALLKDGTLAAWGPTDLPASGLSNVVAIALGGSHRLALKADGTVVAWGSNTYGQTNVPAGLSNVTAIAAGNAHSLALRADGSVVAWGANSFGQGSVPAGVGQMKAIAAGGAHNLAVDVTGRVTAWGNNSFGQASVPPDLSNVIAVAAGLGHSMALKTDGTVVAWGNNSLGQTAVPSGLSRVVALSVYGSANLALVSGDIPPFISYQPVGGPVPLGTNFSFLCLAQGSSPLKYQWQHNGTNIPSAGTAIMLSNLQASQLGLYTVSVSNAFGTIQSADAFLTVTDDVPLFVRPTGGAESGPGSIATFQVLTTNNTGNGFSPAQLASYQLQVSTNLQDWMTLPNALVWTNGSLWVQDPGATTQRFYRVLQH